MEPSQQKLDPELFKRATSQFKILFVVSEQEAEKVSSVLTVFQDTGMEFKVTTGEDFDGGKLRQRFDAVMIYATVGVERLRLQQDFLKHYMTAPITCLAVAEHVAEGFKMPGKLGKKIIKTYSPCPPMKIEGAWKPIFDEMKQMWVDTIKEKVGKVFAEFDKDGSGTIDKDELRAMMNKMGTALTDEQVENALKDLDTNGDGVIDFMEMMSWYFRGMQPYSERTRILNQMQTQLSNATKVLADPNVLQMVKENGDKKIKQKVRFGYNMPEGSDFGTDAMFRVNFFGPEYEKYKAASEALGAKEALKEMADKDIMPMDDDRTSVFFFSLELEAPQAAINEFKKSMEGFFDGLPTWMKVKLDYPAGKIFFQAAIPLRENYGDEHKKAPEDIIAALAGQEQFFEAHLKMASTPAEILGGKKIFDCLQKGFSAKVELQYVECLMAILEEVPMLQEAFKQVPPLKFAGLGTKAEVDATINLSYKHVEDLKQNPHLSRGIQFDLDMLIVEINQMFRHPLKLSKDEYANYQSEDPPVDERTKTAVKEMVERNQGAGGSALALLGLKALTAANALSTLLKSCEGPSPVTLNFMSFGRPHVQLKLSADGWAPAAGLAFNIMTSPIRKEQADRLKRNADE